MSVRFHGDVMKIFRLALIAGVDRGVFSVGGGRVTLSIRTRSLGSANIGRRFGLVMIYRSKSSRLTTPSLF